MKECFFHDICEVTIHKSQNQINFSSHIQDKVHFRVYEKTRVNIIASTVAGEGKVHFKSYSKISKNISPSHYRECCGSGRIFSEVFKI
jgi:hypothetical protein